MAIYRTGQASLDANGIVTGYGTKWRKSLSLIRVGATIIFIDTPAYATIIDVVSDTELRVTDTAGKAVAKSDYVILLHDSLSVDGLAQDVAETLRYYQGKENEFAHFIELVQNMDIDEIKKVVDEMKAEVQKFEENFKKIEAKAEEVERNANEVSLIKGEIELIHTDTENLKNQAQSSALQAQSHVNAAAAEVEKAEAEVAKAKDEVETARREVENARAEVAKATAQADRAQGVVDGAKVEVVNAAAAEVEKARNEADRAKGVVDEAKADIKAEVQIQVDQATAEAERAKNEADRAAQLADQMDTTKVMLKDNNLSDLTDKAEARRNLGVDNIVHDALETKVMTPSKQIWFSMRNQSGMPWGVWDNSHSKWLALGFEQGGTGALSKQGARENLEVDRVVQAGMRSELVTANKNYRLFVGDEGDWGVLDKQSSHVALPVGAGGTGAKDVDGARKAFKVNRFNQARSDLTEIYASDNLQGYKLFLRNDGYWGVMSDDGESTKALPIEMGGTGGVNAAAARSNLEVPSAKETGLVATGVIAPVNANDIKYNGFFAAAGAGGVNYANVYWPGIVMRRVNSVVQIQGDPANGRLYTRGTGDGTNWSAWTKLAQEGDGVTFKQVTIDARSDEDTSASGIVIGRALSANGATLKHYYRIYSEKRNDGKGYLTLHIRGVNGANKYLGYDENGDLTGINALSVSDVARTQKNLRVIARPEGLSGSLNNMRGSKAGFYYQSATVNATQGNAYPSTSNSSFSGMAGSLLIMQNGANGSEACSQFYDQFTGVGGMKFRRLKPDGAVTDHGGANGWKEFLTNNGDVAGGGTANRTVTNWDSIKYNHVAFGYPDASNSPGLGGTVLTVANHRFEGYPFQMCVNYSSNRAFLRVLNGDQRKWTAWKEFTTTAVSDATLKEIKGNLNVEGALDNINRMEFKIFRFLDDAPEKGYRRGVISQQIKQIDREYVRTVGGKLHLDQTPMLLDSLAAIKALRARDEANKERIATLEDRVARLEALVESMISK